MRGLWVGDVAKLVGVTPKTVGHYEKLGLLGPAARSPSGYRLYSPADLLQLRETRHLQALGLRLDQIGRLLGAPGEEFPLPRVLEALRAEIVGQIAALEERRAEIEPLLAQVPNGADGPGDTPPTLRLIEQALGERPAAISGPVREQARRVLARLDDFAWPDEYRLHAEEVAACVAADPGAFERIHALDERIAALADLPEDSPEVEQLVDDFDRFCAQQPIADDGRGRSPQANDPIGQALSEVLSADLAPAQRRFFRLLADRSGR